MTPKTVTHKDTITRNTLLPLGLVITLLGAVFWLSQIYSTVQFHSSEIGKIGDKLDRLLDQTVKTQSDLEVIKTRVEDIRKPLANTQANVRRINSFLNGVHVDPVDDLGDLSRK
jgi:hypothetical protein